MAGLGTAGYREPRAVLDRGLSGPFRDGGVHLGHAKPGARGLRPLLRFLLGVGALRGGPDLRDGGV